MGVVEFIRFGVLRCDAQTLGLLYREKGTGDKENPVNVFWPD